MRVRVVMLLVAALATVTMAQRPGETVRGDAATRVDEYLTRLLPYGFSGAVLIAKDGQVILRKGYGFADRAAKVPYTADLVSCIGSVTKQFTGAAIVKLEMLGKLKTSDPISKYLPGVPADKAGITIHHLLTHTAGFSGDLGGMDETPISRDDLVAKVLAAPLAGKPGEVFEYSNEGFSLAGAIVEQVSGQGYEAFLRQHLFLPADMNETGYLAPAWPLAKLPVGYRENGQAWGRTFKNGWLPDGPGWYLRANGGIHASLDDLYRWHLALESTRVLSADALKKYQSGQTSANGGEMYAYGWGVRKTRRGTSVISHNGGNGFFFTDFRRYLDEKVVIIAMTNQPVVPATSLAPRELESLVFGDAPVVMPPVAVDVPRAARDARTGRYALDDGGTLTVRSTTAGLEVESSDSSLFGGPTFAAAGGRFVDFERRTATILEAAAKGNFRPHFEAFADDRQFEVVQGNQQRYWDGWRSEFGDFSRIELLGTRSVQGDPAVAARLHFARGSVVVQYIWGPRRLAGFMILPPVPPAALIAESPTSWVHYTYRLPAPVRVVFNNENSVTVTTSARTLRGTRSR